MRHLLTCITPCVLLDCRLQSLPLTLSFACLLLCQSVCAFCFAFLEVSFSHYPITYTHVLAVLFQAITDASANNGLMNAQITLVRMAGSVFSNDLPATPAIAVMSSREITVRSGCPPAPLTHALVTVAV